MVGHIWTLCIIQYIDIQFNSRLVKTHHIIPDVHNYFIENLSEIHSNIKNKCADKKFM